MTRMVGVSRRWPGQRTVGAAVAVTGVAVLVAAGMIRDRSVPTDFGATLAPAGAAATPGPPATGAAGRVLDSVSPRSSTPRRHAVTPIHAGAPSQVTIPKLGVNAHVRPVLTSNGQLAVPADPSQLGWWTGSARVGATTGTVVIDGHVDSAATGPGALFLLTDLRASDRIVVTTVDGRHQEYQVIGRRAYVKANGLPPALFTTSGAPRLMLITCGGPFNQTTRSYLDNIVIFATPTGPRDRT